LIDSKDAFWTHFSVSADIVDASLVHIPKVVGSLSAKAFAQAGNPSPATGERPLIIDDK